MLIMEALFLPENELCGVGSESTQFQILKLQRVYHIFLSTRLIKYTLGI